MEERTRKPTILVVDDQPENVEILVQALDEFYDVQIALNGAEALQIAQSKSPPDLILLDIMMPGMDGYEVCHRLRSDEQTREIPVLFISSLNQTSDLVRAFQVGGLDYITKPFQREEVMARVETHLTLRFMQRKVLEQNRELADINTALIAANSRQEAVNRELQEALAQVKRLSGLLPICSSCKKIRDDAGYWQQIESYITDHSEADFTHSICPDCASKLYPDLKGWRRD